ncbi:aldehyde dehydrogenase family protein, partial [Aeromicrobium sp. P5_D10]
MSSPSYQVTDPSTGEVLESFDTATDAEIESALASATTAYSAWKDVP